MRLLLLFGLLTGCSAPLIQRPGQAQAQAIVWSMLRASAPDPNEPPPVDWELPGENDGDECEGPKGVSEPGVLDDGTCVAGYSLPGLNVVVWLGSFHESAFAHEDMHAWQADRGIFDSNHTRPEWKTLLPQINMQLTTEGY